MTDPVKGIVTKKLQGKQIVLKQVGGKSQIDVGVRIEYTKSGWELGYFKYSYIIDKGINDTPQMTYTKIFEAGDRKPFEEFKHGGQLIREDQDWSSCIKKLMSYNDRIDSLIESATQASFVFQTVRNWVAGLEGNKEEYAASKQGRDLVDFVYNEYNIKMMPPYIS